MVSSLLNIVIGIALLVIVYLWIVYGSKRVWLTKVDYPGYEDKIYVSIGSGINSVSRDISKRIMKETHTDYVKFGIDSTSFRLNNGIKFSCLIRKKIENSDDVEERNASITDNVINHKENKEHD